MDQLQFPNIAGNFQQGYAFGNEVKKQKQAEQDQNMLRGLAPRVIAGDLDALTQAATIDPTVAGKYDDVNVDIAKRGAGAAKYMLEAVKRGNPNEIQGRWQSVIPYLSKLAAANGKPPPPPNFDPAMTPLMEQLVARSQGLDASSEMPTGFRQFEMTAAAAGLTPGSPEYQQAANIALGREGRAATGGFGFELVEGLDGRKRLQRRNPRSGMVETYDEMSGDFVPFGSTGGGAPGPAPSAPPREASGMPVVFDDPAAVPPNVQAAIQANPEGWGAVPDGTSARIGPQTPPVVSAMGVSRSPEEQAALTTLAQENAKLGVLPQQEAIKTQAAIQQAGGVAEVQAGIKRDADLATAAQKKAVDARTTLGLLDEAEALLGQSTGSRAGAARDVVASTFGVSTEGAQAIAKLQPIAASLTLAVPRMEGPQSDADRLLYQKAAGDFANPQVPSETRMASLVQMRRLAQKYAGGQGGASGSQTPARVQSAADYDALPSGATFTAPDGTVRRKR